MEVDACQRNTSYIKSCSMYKNEEEAIVNSMLFLALRYIPVLTPACL
jgi:hypothetical protein